MPRKRRVSATCVQPRLGDAGETAAAIDRRQFSVAAALALLGGATITLGCGGGSSSSPTASNPPAASTPPEPDPPATGDEVGQVAMNHAAPHIAVITAAQLRAGGDLLLDITGEGLHGHLLTLTAAQVAQIAGGARVSEDSTLNPHSNGTDWHRHRVTFN